MSKKTVRGSVSKNSSTTPTTSSATQNAPKSSVSKSAFAPSRLQLALFASVIQGFESQNLRVHDTNTGRLRCQHSARAGTTITSLDWGHYGVTSQEPQSGKKKRKREQNKAENVVIAYGTSTSEIYMFSPAEGAIVGRLGNAHERGIRDFKFTAGNSQEGWSIGGDGKLVQWDLAKDQPVRTISLPDPNIQVLASPTKSRPQVLCASSTPFTIDIESSDDFRIESYDSFKTPVHTLYRSSPDDLQPSETFLAVDAGRYINIFDVAQKLLLRTLIAGAGVELAELYTHLSESNSNQPHQLLAVVTGDGGVELFTQPFAPPNAANGGLKSKNKGLTRKASAQVRLISQSPKAHSVPIFNASIRGPELLVATAQGGVDISFQKIRWQDEVTGELLFDGLKEVVYNKAASTLNAVTINGVKDTGRSAVDESRTVVVDAGTEGSSQAAAIAISSSDEEGNDASEEDEKSEELSDSDVESTTHEGQPTLTHEVELPDASDGEMQDALDHGVVALDQGMQVAEAASDVEDVEPTFGELLASRHQGVISIAEGLQSDSLNVAQLDTGKSLASHSGISLATVLTQSLRTNDTNLLESCFHASETDIVKSTIQRLDSSLAGILLSKLAERLSSRPGRYGHLLTWMQWTCVVHGGAIAGSPDVISTVRTLYKVLTQRSNSLDPLLLLKGKLDMLDAQLSLRKEIQARRQLRDPQDAAGVIYMEGQDSWSTDEDEAVGVNAGARKGKQPRKTLDELVGDSEADDEDMPMTNGVTHSDSDEEEEDSGDEAGLQPRREQGLIDDEAEESDEESHPSDNEDEDSDAEENSDEEDEDEDEEDSEMDDFINDDSISVVEAEDDIDIDRESTPETPAVKRRKRA